MSAPSVDSDPSKVDIEAHTPAQEQATHQRPSHDQPRPQPETEPIRLTPHAPAVTAEKVEEGWKAAYDELKRLDEKMVAEYREEIDTLLVFVSVYVVGASMF
jgi:hypothetical protein